MTETESWRYIPNYDGKYQISNQGNIKSKNRGSWKLLNPRRDGHGYLIITLCENGMHKNKKVHRLVAEAFLANPEGLPCVNHKDENKQNNEVGNLEWCTYSYNNKYGSRPEKITEKNGTPVYQCLKRGEIIKLWPSILSAERTLGIDNSNISGCCTGKRKTAGGYMWRRANEC